MGRRVILLASLVVCVACSKPEDAAPITAATPPPGAQAHSERGQVNPNAQMPTAGSKL